MASHTYFYISQLFHSLLFETYKSLRGTKCWKTNNYNTKPINICDKHIRHQGVQNVRDIIVSIVCKRKNTSHWSTRPTHGPAGSEDLFYFTWFWKLHRDWRINVVDLVDQKTKLSSSFILLKYVMIWFEWKLYTRHQMSYLNNLGKLQDYVERKTAYYIIWNLKYSRQPENNFFFQLYFAWW